MAIHQSTKVCAMFKNKKLKERFNTFIIKAGQGLQGVMAAFGQSSYIHSDLYKTEDAKKPKNKAPKR